LSSVSSQRTGFNEWKEHRCSAARSTRRSLIALVSAALALVAVSVVAANAATGTTGRLQLTASPKFVNCLAKYRTIL
jgi:hypothetical protein